jgi:hypothetical protein
MNLIAKPIVKGEYWVVTDGDKKVGNVLANGSGFDVKINGTNMHYKNTSDIKRKTRIEFQTLKTNRTKTELPFASYPTTAKVYNSVFDIKRKLHLYTKTQKSKCYFAAGYYVMNQSGQNEVVFCPKYIFVQRYPYAGPFKTESEAKCMINSL